MLNWMFSRWLPDRMRVRGTVRWVTRAKNLPSRALVVRGVSSDSRGTLDCKARLMSRKLSSVPESTRAKSARENRKTAVGGLHLQLGLGQGFKGSLAHQDPHIHWWAKSFSRKGSNSKEMTNLPTVYALTCSYSAGDSQALPSCMGFPSEEFDWVRISERNWVPTSVGGGGAERGRSGAWRQPAFSLCCSCSRLSTLMSRATRESKSLGSSWEVSSSFNCSFSLFQKAPRNASLFHLVSAASVRNSMEKFRTSRALMEI